MTRSLSDLLVVLAVAFAFVVVPACKHGHGHDDHDHSGDHDHHDDGHKRPDGKIPKAFELDDGKKWQMDEHTRASIKRMDGLLAKAGEDHPALAKALEAELEVLIKGCTMKGEAHQNLHIFIAALFARFDGLKKGGKEGGIALIETKTLFERYHAAFE